jgi:hypothetical protein
VIFVDIGGGIVDHHSMFSIGFWRAASYNIARR